MNWVYATNRQVAFSDSINSLKEVKRGMLVSPTFVTLLHTIQSKIKLSSSGKVTEMTCQVLEVLVYTSTFL